MCVSKENLYTENKEQKIHALAATNKSQLVLRVQYILQDQQVSANKD